MCVRDFRASDPTIGWGAREIMVDVLVTYVRTRCYWDLPESADFPQYRSDFALILQLGDSPASPSLSLASGGSPSISPSHTDTAAPGSNEGKSGISMVRTTAPRSSSIHWFSLKSVWSVKMKEESPLEVSPSTKRGVP
jgi:hypothetical protein